MRSPGVRRLYHQSFTKSASDLSPPGLFGPIYHQLLKNLATEEQTLETVVVTTVKV